MMKIICNPYAERPFPKILINNEPLTPNSSLARVENQPLQDSLYPSSGWNGLFQTIESSLGLATLTMKFIGNKEEFQALKTAYDSFRAAKGELIFDFIIDSELAADISPASRKNFLLNQLRTLKNFCLKDTAHKKYIENCIELVISEKNSDVKKILACKSILEEYFREHFQTDEKNILDYTDHLNKTRADKFENGNLLPLTEARCRYQFLIKICDDIRLITPHIAQKISKKFSHMNWPEPDFSLVKIEFDGVVGYWLEETDASIQTEKFRLAVKKCYGDLIETYLASDWLSKIKILREKESDAYLNKWAELFGRCRAWKNFNSVDAERTKYTVTYNVPAYFPGQTARQITRVYVEVVEYEKNFLKAVHTNIAEQSETFLSNVNSVLNEWLKDLEEYRHTLNRLEKAEELLRRLKKLRDITERLTSIDCKLDEEKKYE